MKNTLLFIFCSIVCIVTTAQELKCNVSVIAPKNQNVAPTVFKNLENAIMEFMNGRKWTSDNYKENERIKCSIIINITDGGNDGNFTAKAIISSMRPVYNSNYNSPLLTYQDQEFNFAYQDLQILDYNDNTFSSQLTSLLAFYANIIIGYDALSFDNNSSEVYFQKALTIANNIPINERSRYKGWSKLDGTRNRFVLVDNWLNPRYKDLSKSFLMYHFYGMDHMYEDIANARSIIISGLSMMQVVNKDNPNAMPIRLFFEAKQEELINIFSKADFAERTMISQLLSTLDPINADVYKKLNKN